jgi:hypothetical protein
VAAKRNWSPRAEGMADASKALPPPGGAEPLDQAAPGVLAADLPAMEQSADSASPPGESPDAPAAARGAGVGALLGCVRMSRTSEGGVRLEAPPEAADELIRLFEGMAALFRSSLG